MNATTVENSRSAAGQVRSDDEMGRPRKLKGDGTPISLRVDDDMRARINAEVIKEMTRQGRPVPWSDVVRDLLSEALKARAKKKK